MSRSGCSGEKKNPCRSRESSPCCMTLSQSLYWVSCPETRWRQNAGLLLAVSRGIPQKCR